MEEHMELQEMREQLELLKAQVAKQQLMNDLNVRKMAKNKVSGLKSKFWLKISITVFGLLYCPWAFWEILNASVWFIGVTELFLLVCLVAEIYSHWDLWNENLNFNMADYARRMLRIKKMNAWWFKWGMIFIFPWFAWFVWEAYKNSEFEFQWIGILIGGIIGGIIGFGIGYRIYRKEQSALQELADSLEELSQD